ncbi:MAG: hypothetical protein MUF31_04485 [Akkermansiaceae bacterium]|nr:hypothetical protein [Akkermansiaceae bacterium]
MPANSMRGFVLTFRVRLTVTVVTMLLVQDFRFLPGVALAGRGGDQNRGGKQAEDIHRGPL